MTGGAICRAILDPTLCALWPDQLDAVEQLEGWRNQTLLMQIVNDAVVVIDVAWRIRRWNPAAEAIYGWSAAEVIGKQIDAIIPVVRYFDGGSNEVALAALERAGTWRGEVVQPHRNGQELSISSMVRLIRDEGRRPLGMIAVNRDVTQQRRIEEQQRLMMEAEQRARQLAEVLRAANLSFTSTLDVDTILAELLRYLHQLVPYDRASVHLLNCSGRLVIRAQQGYNPDPAEGQGSMALSHLFDIRQGLRFSSSQSACNWQCMSDYGRGVSWLGVPLVAGGTVIGGYTAEKSDADGFTDEHVGLGEALAAQAAVAIQNALLFEEIRSSQQQLALLSRRLVLVQETERASLARELHDEIGQTLTGLKIMLDLASTASHGGTSGFYQGRLADACTIVGELMEHVRELSLNLHPAILDDLGLLPALLWLVGRYTSQTMIRIDLRHNGLDRRFAPEVETVVYRVVQEALTNIARHAHAPSASVQILAERNLLIVRVEDRGWGFDPALLASPNSYGLRSMHERVALVGGQLTIEARPGAGTCLIAELPLDDQKEQIKEHAI